MAAISASKAIQSRNSNGAVANSASKAIQSRDSNGAVTNPSQGAEFTVIFLTAGKERDV